MKLIKKKFYFVPYGKKDWDEKNLCYGQKDIPLNELGRKEIKELISSIFIPPFSKIVTSPLAYEIAHIIQSYRLSPIEIIDRIKEREWGLEESTNLEMYHLEEQENNPKSTLYFNSEKQRTFKTRVLKGINYALKNETPLIVAHWSVFLILLEIMGIEQISQISHTAIFECCPGRENWNMKIHSNKD